jgi:hypothetical protein
VDNYTFNCYLANKLGASSIRLSFATADAAKIKDGIAWLRQVV